MVGGGLVKYIRQAGVKTSEYFFTILFLCCRKSGLIHVSMDHLIYIGSD